MTDRKLLAYEGYDGFEGFTIVFAEDSVTAEKYVSWELDCDVSDVEWVKRVEDLDIFAPGPVPIKEMLYHGWAYECSGCGYEISVDMEDNLDDMEDNLDDVVEHNLDDVVEHNGFIFHNEYCLCKYEEHNNKTNKKKLRMIIDLTNELKYNLPEAIITHSHAHIDADYNPDTCAITFSFPGSNYKGSCEIIRQCTDLDKNAYYNGYNITVMQGDFDLCCDWVKKSNGNNMRWLDDGGLVIESD